MNHQEVGQYWNKNAEAWTVLARAGYDVYRNYLNTPAFFATLPSVQGLHGLDIGCGEGYNTRLLAQAGARIEAIDISEVFIQKAHEEESVRPLGIRYHVASAVNLPFATEQFDFATSFMCLMDIPETEMAIQEAFRVIKRGGFLQFSISHPCFTTRHRKNIRTLGAKTIAIQVGEYFHTMNGVIEEWIFKSAPARLRNHLRKFRVPVFSRTLSQWFNTLIQAGFQIEYVHEPCPDDASIAQHPALQDSKVAPYFLHIRCRKPLAAL
jgi:ubiquinone/menaquinone biosynthesis C-methylase UbiE